MALLISQRARHRLRLEHEPWLVPGKVRLPNVRATRLVAARINEIQEETPGLQAGASAGAVRALELIEDAQGRIARHHLDTAEPGLIRDTVDELAKSLGKGELARSLESFSGEFLGSRRISREEALIELLLFWVQHNNPAAATLTSVLHDTDPEQISGLRNTAQALTRRMSSGEDSGEGLGEKRGGQLLELLLAPQKASSDSLLGQLQFLLQQSGDLLDEQKTELLGGLDLFAEELAPRFAGGPGPAEAPTLDFEDADSVQYSSDRSWMPQLVLMAKNVYVWLDQLSRHYGASLRHLDDIPDAELARLASQGVTGLWLIGVWERSTASQRVKQMCGNPEAVASAYSLRRYKIADELGGEVALQRLKRQAWSHGIRLAADMVPNHMGIDSDWVTEKPDWFLGASQSPFPAYSFDGPDFSNDPSVGIFLEDHYFDRSDAAVVFKRTDHGTGEDRFIYHGNDGTTMPWNDTAQLDYLHPEVREAVMDTILDVARRFPVIRFDAAMTLAKRHYQRLWFPEPGTAGAIPSRAEHGMTRSQFQEAMPEEFWREVVDRVSNELPDTLLLAEAFWLMEGYFVRTLGMHRVYNSAFMNMLRDQQNDKYRRLLKETLAFDPQILQRYVNFMSNPDEETALEQFGKDDRYFGACVMMATLPGLPMFAHGQFEGFAEKYGMEYRRAYWNEEVDADLMARHEREIVPLLKHRHVFASVENFRLYDLVDTGGVVHEDVFAYSNGLGEERSLVLFNNRFQDASGRIRYAAPVAQHGGSPIPEVGESESLYEVLEIAADEKVFITFRDSTTGLEYLASSRELRDQGLEIELGAFHYRVLTGFRDLRDDEEGLYARLAQRLGGAGVESVEQARQGLQLEPLRDSWRRQVQPALLQVGSTWGPDRDTHEDAERSFLQFGSALEDLAIQARAAGGARVGRDSAEDFVDRIRALRDSAGVPNETKKAQEPEEPPDMEDPQGEEQAASTPDLLPAALVWVALSVARDALGPEFSTPSLLEEWSLKPEISRALAEMGTAPAMSSHLRDCIASSLEMGWGRSASPVPTARTLLDELLANESTRHALQVHSFQGVDYLNREALETMLRWRRFLEHWVRISDPQASELEDETAEWSDAVNRLEASAGEAGYRIDRLRKRLAVAGTRTPG